jgi:hypothetical protein
MVRTRNDRESSRPAPRGAKEATMASIREREVEEPSAEPNDFRTLLLGAWPDGGEEGPGAGGGGPGCRPRDDPQWITWSDVSAEEAWEDIEVSLTLGGCLPVALTHGPLN